MKAKAKPLTIRQILETSQARSRRWHAGGEPWGLVDWSNAIAGETGEMCNAIKKLRRVVTGAKNINNEPGRQLDESNAKSVAVRECADILLYMPMLIEELGYTPEQFERIIRDVFNRKSEEYSFPERL